MSTNQSRQESKNPTTLKKPRYESNRPKRAACRNWRKNLENGSLAVVAAKKKTAAKNSRDNAGCNPAKSANKKQQSFHKCSMPPNDQNWAAPNQKTLPAKADSLRQSAAVSANC
jgi:hypothetical protein